MNNRTFTFKGALLCFLLMAAALPTALYAQQATGAVKDMSKDQIKHLIKESSNSIRFVDNNGQLPSDIKVAGLSNIGNVYLKKDHLYFVSVGSTAQEEHEGEEEEDEEYIMGPDGNLIEEHHGKQVAHRWGISFVGANEYNIERKNILPTKYNYFLDSDKTKWATNVSSYGEVELNNVYEGISMRMYSQEHNTMEFDWVVNAGADFRKIKMNFKGQDKLAIDEKGQLEVKLRFKEVKFDIPESYQVIGGKKVPVKMEFVIDGDVVSFKTSAKINSSYPLIIDPSLKWGTFFDDNDNDFDEYAYAVELDAVGNMYVGGASNNQLVRSATTGYGSYIFGYDSTYADGVSGSNVGRRDAIIYRIAANGSALQYVTYFGGTSPDVAYGLSLSPSGNALFVCGATNSDQGTSPGIPLVNTPFDGTKNGQDGFVAVFNSTLTSLTYSSYIGGTGTGDEMYSIRAINDNSYVIGGVVTSDGSFNNYINNGYSNNYRGGDEMYIGKFTNFRTLSWGTYIGGTGNDQLNDIQLFSDGAVAFSGASSSSTSFPALFNNVAQGVANSTGGIDGVIGVIPANGGNNVEMLSRFGGTGDDEFYGLAIGQFDTLFVTGYTSSTNFYLGPNSTGNRFQTTKGTGQDAFLGKLPRRGCQSCSTDPWVATYFGGNADDRGNTLRTYTPYAVMVFGETGSNRYPFNKNLDDGGAFFDSTFNGDTWDVFYMVLGTDLRTQYFGTLIGGANNDYLGATGDPRGSNQFMVEGDSLICVATTTHSSSLTPDPIGNSFDLTNSTGGDDKHLVFKWRIGILLNFDYADAPASYGSPNHVVFNSLKLGSVIDKEDFPQPSYKADGDDLLTSDDEDGIAGTQVLVQDTSTTFTRSVSVTNQTGVTAMLMGWIDFNGDGDFLDANEVDTVLVPANATSATLRWTGYNASNIFRNAPNDTTYMRIRLTTQSSFFVTNPSPTAGASNGEVEDYLVIRYHCVNLTGATIDTNSTTSCGTATGSIVVTNGNLFPGVQYGVYYTKDGGAPQGPFYYTTNGSNGSLTISGLSAGTYTAVQVFHPTNPACGFTLPNTLIIKDAVPASAGPDQTICQPATTASLGTAPQYTWSFVSGPSNATVNATSGAVSGMNNAGVYTFQLGSGNCIDLVQITVVERPKICLTKKDLPCSNICQGQISLQLCNTVAPSSYTVLWSNGSTATTITGLCAGTYTVTVTNNTGCSATASMAIQTQTEFTSAINFQEPTINQNNGSIDLTVIGGTAPFAYIWSNGATTQDLTNIGAGTYGVTITDNTGRVITDLVTINSVGATFAGSIIVDMGVLPQTYDNGLKPYGLVYDLVRNFGVPIKWVINSNKKLNPLGSPPRYDVDFTYNGKDYKGGPFVIDEAYLSPAVRSAIASWQSQGVQLDTISSTVSLPVYQVITSFPNTVIDQQNEGLVIPYYQNANVPSSTYTVGLPSSLDACDDVYALPHADPTWANHSNLFTFNTTVKGYIWSGCHAVSELEGLFNPSNTSQRMNFLSNTGLQCWSSGDCGTFITESHGNPTTPFSYDTTLGSEPIMQLMSDMTPAQNNGSEQWYIPVTTGSWRSTTKTAVRTNDAPGTNRQGVKLAYGPGFGNTNNGMVMYQGGHRANGSESSEVAFARAYFNFLLMTGVEKQLAITAVNVPAGFYAGVSNNLSIAVTGGSGSYTYQWSSSCGGTFGSPNSPSTTFTIPANTPVNTRCLARVTVTDACGRVNFYSKVITVIPNIDPVRYITSTIDSARCFSQCNGTITGTGAGGTPPYTYLWSNGATTATISNLCAGTYRLTITDSVGCQKLDTITIGQPADITANFNVTQPTCAPLANGSVTTTVGGGTAGYTYLWSNGATTKDLSNIASGTYSLTITDSKNCTKVFSVTVNNSTTFTPTAGSGSPVYCEGQTIQLTSTGGGTYSWSGPASFSSTLQNPTRPSATTNFTGTYTVTVTSPAGCTGTASVNVSVTATPPSPTSVNANPNPICSGNTLTLTATGTALVWTYPGGQTANGSPVTRTNVTTGMAGVYSVTQTVNGCTSAPATVTVTVNPTPSITLNSTTNPTTCGGSQGTIVLTGLTANTTYAVSYTKNSVPQGPFSFTANGSGVLTITGLTAGAYTNVFVSLAGCPSTPLAGTITLSDPNTPATPTASSNSPVCSGNAINLTTPTVSGGSYSWTGPLSYSNNSQNPTITGATTSMAGSYCVVVTVANCASNPGCTNVVVNQTPAISTTGSTNPTTCGGNDGTITLSGLLNNTSYSVRYTRNGTALGPFSLTSNGAGVVTISGLNQGSYTDFTVSVNGCQSAPFAGPITLTDPAAPSAPSVSSNSPVCSGNTISLSATGSVGASYNWTGPLAFTSTLQNPTRANATVGMSGSYCATQTVAGCVSPQACVTVVVNQTPIITSSTSTNPTTCGGTTGTIVLNGLNINTLYTVNYLRNLIGQGPFGITTDGSGTLTITGLTAGSYTNVNVTLLGCVSANAGPFTLSDPTTPAAPTASSNSPICSGNTINLSATGQVGATFNWTGVSGDNTFSSTLQNPTRANATTDMSGSYCVTQTVAGCVSPQACTNVVVNQTPTFGIFASTNPTTCAGNQGTITLSGLNPNVNYSVAYTKTPGGSQGPFVITSGASGQLVISGLTAGSYSGFVVTLVSTGCPSGPVGGPVVLTDPATPSAPFVSSNTPVCSGNSITLFATGETGATYSWTGQLGFTSTQQNPIIPNATTTMTGNYCATQTVAGCTSASACTAVTVNQTPGAPTANASPNPICSGNTLTLTATGLVGATFTWTFPDGGGTTGSPVIRNNVTAGMGGLYTVTQTINGCTSTTPGTVNVTLYPTPGIPSASNNGPVCVGSSIQLNTPTVLGATYSWTGPNAFTSSAQNPVIINASASNAGTYSVTVFVNGCPSTAPGTTTVTVNNCRPIAVRDVYGSCVVSPITGNILTNDIDPSGNGIQISLPNVCGPFSGTITVNSGGTFTYTPPVSFNSVDSICYKVCNVNFPTICDTGIAVFDYTCVNLPPVAVDDRYNINEDDTLTGNVTTNDFDPDGGIITVDTTLICSPQHGTVAIAANGTFTYIPTANYNGPDTFCYRICDNGSPIKCDDAIVVINVIPVNDPPITVPDTTVTTPEDTPIIVCIPIDDVEVNTQSHNVNICGSPVNGTITSGPDVNNPLVPRTVCLTYRPNTNFNGNDSICLIICDNGTPVKCDTSHINIIVTPVNDPPVALNDNYTTNEDVTITTNATTGVRNNDNDNADGNPVTSLTVTGTPVTPPAHGVLTLNPDGSFTYVPTANYNGSDSFQYRVCDAGTPPPSLCDTATAYITILPVNDPPVVIDTPITTCEDCGPVTVCVPVTDNDPGQTHYVAATYCGPNSGIANITLNGPLFNSLCVTYNPNTNFNGNDSICIIVCDNGIPNLCDTSHITITVTPVNDPPVALNDNYTTAEDVTITTNATTGVRNNDNDNADGNPVTSLTVTGTPIVPPAHGTLTLNPDGSFTYVPTANYSGTDSFQYRVCDNGTPLPSLCDTATAYITITPVNDPPFVPDTTVTTPEDTPIVVCLPITDLDVTNQHIASFCDAPDNGVITSGPIVDNNTHTVCITYRPNANFNGNDSICLTVCDNGIPSLCDNTTIRIIVTPVNDPPIAVNDNYTTREDSTIIVPVGTGVRANDNDNADGNPVTSLTVTTTPINGPTHGTITLNPNGSFTYDPDTNYYGIDSFQYRVCDAGTPPPSLCDTATAYITINPFNDPPVIIDTPVTTCEDCPITVCIPFTDEDVTDIHAATLLCNPVNGTVTNLTVNTTTRILCFTYQSYLNVNGKDSLCIVVCDNGNPVKCDTSHIIITIDPVNDPPYADTIRVTTYENIPIGVNVASATGDIEGDPLSYSYGGVVPGGGTYYITGNGAIVFVPNPGFTGTATIPYGVCDLSPYPVNVLCDSAAIIITVLPTSDTINNHAPVANNDYITTPRNTAVVINELANDYDPDNDPLQVTVTGLPAHGTVTTNPNGTVNYTPNTGYFGFDTIRYVICDPVGTTQPRPLCDDAIIVIYISTDTSSRINDAPVAVDDFADICADATTVMNVLRNDYDINGNALTSVTVIRNVTNGALVNNSLGIYSYDPNNNFAGADTFVYRVCDNGVPSLCDTATAIITVHPIPVITPSAPSLTICSGDSVNLTFTSNVVGTGISWTASNGTSGTGDIHTVLTNTGTSNQVVTYTVVGSTGSGCGSAPLSVAVTVRPRPLVNYVLNNTIFCSGEQVVINLSSNVGSTTYTWSGSNGSSGTGNIITDNPVNVGPADSTVTYTINSLVNGCAGTTLTVPVTVKPRPVITATPSAQTVCSGTPITVTLASNIAGTTVLWAGSNGNSGNTFVINDSPINNGTSNLTVTYTVNSSLNGCAGTTVFATVTVRPRVVADAGTDKSVTSCSGSCVALGGSPTGTGGSGALTYAWSPSVSLNDTSLANPTACNVTANTTYVVTVTDLSGCSATDAIAITVTPSSLTAEAGSGGALCLGTGDSVMLGGFPTAVGGTPAYTYTWTPTAGLNLTNPANPEAFPDTTTTYYVTVTDALGCISTDSTIVRVYPTLTANAGADTSVCATFPAQLGGIPTATGGFGSGYTYSWFPSTGLSNINSANPTAAPSILTTYTVIVEDPNGCSASDNVVVTVRPNPTAQAGPDKTIVACAGDSVTIGDVPAVTGGTAPYTYRWTPTTGLSDSTIANPVVKGITVTTVYTLLVTDSTGCSSTDNVRVTVVANTLQAFAGPDEAVCSNNNCVQLGGIPTAVGGTSPYAYAWSNGSSLNDSTIANPLACALATTTFTVTITDSKGCIATDAVNVVVNPSPTANAGPDTSVCSGLAVTIGGSPSATGGTPGYTYSWTPTVGLSLPNIANPGASPTNVTTYQLVVVDTRGCSSVDEVTVTPRLNPVVDAGPDKSIVACAGDSVFIGGLPVVTSGGTAPFTYDWTYGTSLSDSTIPNPIVKGLSATTSYQLVVTDTFGCRGVDFVVVNVLPSTLQANAGPDRRICAGAGTQVTIGGNPTAVGGTAPYTYAWSNGAASVGNTPNPTVSPTTTTTYYVTVTDSKGCRALDTVVVTVTPAPIANAGPDTTVCSGFCVNLGTANTGSGGSGALQYAWAPAVGLNTNNTPNPQACPLVTTTYSVVVTDAFGCSASDNVTISIRSNPIADAGADQSLSNCFSDSITIGGSPAASGGAGGYTYQWSPATGLSYDTVSNPVVKGLVISQQYTLVVTDVNGCTAEDAVLVTVTSGTLSAEAGVGGSYCAGSNGSVTLGASPTATGGTPGYSYTWSPVTNLNLSNPANPIASPDTTTKYYVSITDSKGCVATDSVTVTVYPSLTVNAGRDTSICRGFSVVLGGQPTATGGTPTYTYAWAPANDISNPAASNPTATPTATTSYTVRVTDINGCTASDAVLVTVNQLPVADAGADKSLVACSGDSVQIGGSPSASGSGAPYTYLWTPAGALSSDTVANPFVKNLGSSATFTLTVINANGCSSSDQVTVQVNNSTFTAEAGNNVAFCQGASVSILLGGQPTAVGGAAPFTYAWSPRAGLNDSTVANPLATPLVTTTYSVVITDGTGCIAEDTVRITINPRPVVNAGAPDTVCAGSTLVLGGAPTASGGTGNYTYSWTPSTYLNSPFIANPTAQPQATITYVLTVTDSLGCSNNASVTIRVNENPVANAGPDQTVVACPSACVTLGGSPTATNGGGGYLYAWAPSAGLNNTGLANPAACNLSQSLTYSLTVTDVNGCTSTDQVLVNVTQSTLAADAGPDRSICAGSTACVTIGGLNAVSGGAFPYIIDWSPVAGICNSNSIPNPDVNPTDTTTYVLLVTDNLGCIAVDSMVLFANPAVTASVRPDTAICAGGAALLGGAPTAGGGSGGFTYNWSPGTGLSSTTSANPTASPAAVTTYCVTVTDAVGCSASTCQTVAVNPAVCADAGADRTMTNCPGSFTQLGGSPTGGCGSGNYSYAWSPSANLNGSTIPNPIVTGLTVTTTFTVTVTDNVSGCFATDQVTVNVNQTNLAADAGNDRVYCANSNSCVTIGGNPTAVGGQPQYIYQWAPITGLSDATIANPCANPLNTTKYFVTVTDQLGCFMVDSMTVVVSPLIAVNAGVDTSICTATSIILGGNPVVVGGTTPYTYAWSLGAFPSNVAHPTATPVSSSSYSLTVTDSLGCTASDVVNVALRPLPIANAGPDGTISQCSFDSIVLGGSPAGSGTVPPYTYSWFPPIMDVPNVPNPVLDSLGANQIFTLTVTDSFGCQATDQVQVSVVQTVLFVEAGANIGSLCSNVASCVNLGGSPTVSGGTTPYVYQWFGGVNDSTIANPVGCPSATTTYTVIVTDENGCRGADSVTVIVNPAPDASISGLNSSYCVDAGNVLMTGIPAGGTFFGPGVTGNIFQPSTVGAGFWCIQYIYTNPATGCSDDTTICVTVTPLPAVTASGFAPAYCRFDSAVTLVGSPLGGTFTGSPGLSGTNGETFNPATALIGNNTITYSYTDSVTGCSNTYTFVINVKGAPTITLSSTADTSCLGGAVTFIPNFSFDVFNIIWSVQGGGNVGAGLTPFTYTPAATGNYCMIATAINTPNGCVSADTICGYVNTPPVANTDFAETCEEVPVAIAVLTNDTDLEGNTSGITVISAAHGTATVNGDSINYVSNLNYNGADTVVYQICNNNCPDACDTATVFIQICPVNDPPVITDITDTIYINTSDTVCPLIVDIDNAVNTLTVTTFDCDTINGTIGVLNGCITYTPTANWTGTQVICVSVCDTSGACDTGTVTIVVLPLNNPPINQPINVTTCVRTPVGVNTYASSTDPDGNLVTFNYGPVTAGGTWTVTGNGAGVFVSSTPGTYTMQYTVCDISNIPVSPLCDTNTITFTVIACDSANTPPVANDDEVITAIDSTTIINVLANDFDADGDPLNVTLLTSPLLPNATATVNPDGTVTYVSPVAGTDTVVYQICDPYNACDTAIIVIHVGTVIVNNHPPVAVDDFRTTTFMTGINVPVIANDHDPDGDAIAVTSIPCPPADGTATLEANGTITYVPGPNVNAYNPDTFCYVICDNGSPVLCDTAQVVISVVNSVVAQNECTETGYNHEVVIDVLANDYDPEIVDSFWVSTTVNLPNTQGTTFIDAKGEIHYIPRADTCGYIDTFAYVIQDEAGAIDTGYVCVEILCCEAPVGVIDTAQVISGDSVNIIVTLNDTIEGATTVNEVIIAPLHGTAFFINDSTVRYVSAPGYCGTDTFTYAGENVCGFDTALVVVNVICNTKPLAVNDTQTICRQDTLTFNPLGNDTDADGNLIRIAGIGTPSSAGLINVLTLTDSTITISSNGTVSSLTLNYYICDNGLPVKCDTASILINVVDCPQPQVEDIYDTIQSCVTTDSICIESFVNLPAAVWTITNMCPPANGTLTFGAHCFTYVPNTGFYGNDTMCATVCTTQGLCATAQVVITSVDCIIQAVDEPCDLTDTAYANAPITIDILSNDIIPWGGDTTVAFVDTATHGSAVVNANNTVTYTAASGYNGNDQFSYVVCVTTGSYTYCDTANVCIPVADTTLPCFVPNGFSPNGDGVNDNYVIPCNERNPRGTVRIFNRWGVEVWFSDGAYLNDWKGTNMEGTELPDGTYYIIYEYNDGTGKREAKFVVIHR